MDKSNFISNFRQCLICIKRRKGSTISPLSPLFWEICEVIKTDIIPRGHFHVTAPLAQFNLYVTITNAHINPGPGSWTFNGPTLKFLVRVIFITAYNVWGFQYDIKWSAWDVLFPILSLRISMLTPLRVQLLWKKESTMNVTVLMRYKSIN